MNQGGAMWRRGRSSGWVFSRLKFPKSSFPNPNRWRGDLIGGASTCVFSSRAFEAAGDFFGHVLVAEGLAAQAGAWHGGGVSFGHDVSVGPGGRVWGVGRGM